MIDRIPFRKRSRAKCSLGEWMASESRGKSHSLVTKLVTPCNQFCYHHGKSKQRKCEALTSLPSNSFHSDGRLIYTRKQKNREGHTIPLNGKARAVQEQVSDGEEDDYVFRSPGFDKKVELTRFSGQCAAFTPRQVNEVPRIASILVSGTLLRSAVVIGTRSRNGADRDCTSPR